MSDAVTELETTEIMKNKSKTNKNEALVMTDRPTASINTRI